VFLIANIYWYSSENVKVFGCQKREKLFECFGQAAVETIGSKRSYALTWCMPNNDDDDLRKSVLGHVSDY